MVWWRKDFAESYQAAYENGQVKRLTTPEQDSETLKRITTKVPLPTPTEAAEQRELEERYAENRKAAMPREELLKRIAETRDTLAKG